MQASSTNGLYAGARIMPRGTPLTGPFNLSRNAAIIRLWQTGELTYIEIAERLSLPSRCIVAGVIHRHKERIKVRHASPQKTQR